MKTTLISIISDQTIPNVLFLKEVGKNADQFVFLTTESMEDKGKSEAVRIACGLEESRIIRIVIEEDKLALIKKTLYENNFSLTPGTQFLINITGGTKLMSLAVYEYFRNLNSTFYYLPIGKNKVQKIESHFNEVTLPLNYRLSLREYLEACGLTYEQKNLFNFTEKQTSELFEDYRKTRFDFDTFPIEKATRMSVFPVTIENIRGTWFEEFVYYQVKRQLDIPDYMIGSSVMVFKDSEIQYNDNEFDVMFVRDNELFVIECKVHLSGGNQKLKLDTALNKLGAITKNFGLKTKSYLFTLSNLRNYRGKFSDVLIRKCEVLGVEVPVDGVFFTNGSKLLEIFKAL